MTQTIAVGQILQPAMRNKFRVSWGPVDTPDTTETLRYREAITFQIVAIDMVNLPQLSGVFTTPGVLRLLLEHDVGGAVFSGIEWLKTLDDGSELRIEILDGHNTPLQTLVYRNVVISNQSLKFDYAASETLKSDLTCTFGSFSVE